MRVCSRLFLLFFLLSSASFSQNVVVWDFATRDGQKNNATASLTEEFEEALSQNSTYTVIERRKIDRLQAVIENEKALYDIGQISSLGSAELKKQGISIVVFGEIFDDVDSGEVRTTVTFQDLQGKKILIKSILMRRGLLSDATSRRENMAALARSIFGVTAKNGTPVGQLLRQQENDFIFDIQSCSLSDRTVLCRLLITNNGEDRKLFIVLNAKNGGWADETYINPETRTLLYDDFNNAASPSSVQLSNSRADTGDNNVVGAMLISGRPAEASIKFDGLSSKSTTAIRLDITCVDGESKSKFVTTFRNVPLER